MNYYKKMFISFIIIFLVTVTFYLHNFSLISKPVTYLFNKKLPIYSVDTTEKEIALTFDINWAEEEHLDEILQVLKKYDVKGTFFIAGKHANWYPNPLVRASKEGHEIGNHTFNHPDITNLTNAQLEEEILKCEEILIKLTGKKPTLFRPPYGSYKQEELASIAKKLNYKIVLWTTVDARDWQNPAAEVIANKIINKRQRGL